MTTKARHIVLAVTFAVNLLFGGFHSHAEEPTTRLKPRTKVYDASADGSKQIAEALLLAKKNAVGGTSLL